MSTDVAPIPIDATSSRRRDRSAGGLPVLIRALA
jgi:hypothetical protein